MVKKKYKVCILGASLDTGNRGVSALSHSLIKIILERKKDAQITLIVSHHISDIKEIYILGRLIKVKSLNYRLSPKSKLNEHLFWIYFLSFFYKISPIKTIKRAILKSNELLSAIYDADFIGDIQGGDSFSDIYGLARFSISFLMNAAILNLKKDLILLPQTYGPFKSFISRVMASYIMNKANYIISRDHECIELIKSLRKSFEHKKNILYSPDVAFFLDPIKPDKVVLNSTLKFEELSPFLGFNISGLLYQGGYTKDNMFGLQFDYSEFVNELIYIIISQTNERILLIPHTYSNASNSDSNEDDRNACLNVMNRISSEAKDRVYMVTSNHNPGEIKWIINHSIFFIGSRMHSCIAALSQGIPTIGIAYSKKFKGVFESVKMDDFVIDPRDNNKETVIEKILTCYGKKEVYKDCIMNDILQAKEIINSVFNSLII